MDDENEMLGLGGLGPDEEGEETANITAAAEEGALPGSDIRSRYEKAATKYEESVGDVLKQIENARKRVLAQPTEKTRGEYLLGLAQTLAAPRERDDPRFYERRNLYTFLRDVGEYGAAQKEAEKKAKTAREEQLAKIDELKSKYGAESALELMKQLGPSYRAATRPAAASREDEITRLQRERDALDITDPNEAKKYNELTGRINFLIYGKQAAPEAMPGEKEVDKKIGAEYADWVVGGKGAQAASRISKINDVVSQLGKRKDLSGAVVGFTLENLPTASSALFPEAQDVKDVVESVVQTDLRAILGGQFAQKEGEALIKRAYNPRLEEWQNSNRLKLLSRQMQMVADEKNRAMSYFGEKGTIKGYAFKPYTANDFLTADQLKRIDAGESVESVLGKAPSQKPKREPKPAAGAPPAEAAKTPAQRAAEELARRRAAKGG